MGKTTVNIRMDEHLKNEMDEICKELGMNMSTAVTIFAKKMSRERRIPFEVSVDPFYTKSNIAHLMRGIEELNSNEGQRHSLVEEDWFLKLI